jgi:hypothetical protein
MSFGVMGANMQGHEPNRWCGWWTTSKSPQAACDAPRWRASRRQAGDQRGIRMNPAAVQGLAGAAIRWKSSLTLQDFGAKAGSRAGQPCSGRLCGDDDSGA